MGLIQEMVMWTFIAFSAIVLVPAMGEDLIDPCDMRPDGNLSMLMYCTCNGHEIPTEVQCYVNIEIPKNSESRPEWEALATLTETIYLEFVMRNRLMHEFPPPILFQKMEKLRVFYVKTGAIEVIPPFAFQNSSSLVEVNLKDNAIRELQIYAFANMEKVTEINLDTNSILEINRSIFVNLPSLRHLCIGNNAIQVIHDGAFKDLESLEELELQRNNLTYLTPEVFVGLKSLTRLDLMKNTIQFLGSNVFIEMENLKDLDLTENKIISVIPTAFNGLRKLERLNLRGNKIVEFQPGTFSHLQMIYFLDVRENQLETFSEDLVSSIYSNLLNESMQLNMKDNRFKCDCRILWMHKLWNETRSQIVQYYLNQTMCDVPHKFALALDETDLDININGGKKIQDVTLISGPMEETTASTTGSRIRVTTFRGDGLRCDTYQRFHRHGSGHRRVKDRDETKSETFDGVKSEQEEIPKTALPSAAVEPVNVSPEASRASSDSAFLHLPAILTLSMTSIFIIHRFH